MTQYELSAALCILSAGFILLVLVAAVGHGLWVLGAAIVRALAGESPSDDRRSRRRCPRCGRLRDSAGGPCPVCGAAPAGGAEAQSTAKADLYAATRALQRMRERGALAPELHQRLMEMIRDEHESLMGHTPGRMTPLTSAQTRPGAEAPAVESRPAVAAPKRDEIIVAEAVSESPAIEAPPLQSATAAATSSAPTTPAAAHDGEGIQFLPPAAQPASPLAARTSGAVAKPAKPAPSIRPAAPTEPVGAGRTLADLLQAFMEEKNIRWGELVSGLLIVGSGIGLVISLRHTLSAIPYFPALLFMLGTAAIHATGMYTLRRWNLPSTSRCMLIIGMLLVPLSFLAGIVLTGQGEQQREATDPLYLAAVAVGLASFGAMTFFSARALMGEGWWRLSAAVMLPSAGQLLINRLAWPEMPTWQTTALAALPLAGFLAATLAQVQRAADWRRLSQRRVGEMCLLLGVAVFALLASLGLLVWKADPFALGTTLQQLSPSLSLAAAAVLATGLVIYRGCVSRRMATMQTAGIAIAVLGGLSMAALVALAWPEPEMLIAVGLLNGAILAVLAVAGRLPILQTAAVLCFALAFFVGFHWMWGTLAEAPGGLSLRLVQAALMGRSAVAMTLFAALTCAAAVAWLRAERRDDAACTLWGAAAIGVMSLLVAVYVGFAGKLGLAGAVDADLSAPLLLFYAVAALAAGWRIRTPYVTWAGGALLWLALAQALACNDTFLAWLGSFAPQRGVLTATLIHAAVCAALAVGLDQRMQLARVEGRRRTPLFRCVIAPLGFWALATSAAATPFVLAVSRQHYATHAAYAAVVALVWLSLAVNFRWRAMFWAFQAMATVCLWDAVAAIGLARGIYSGAAIDLDFLPVQVTVLAVWCIGWTLLRRAGERLTLVRELMHAPWLAVDQLLLGVLAFVPLGAAIYGCVPGVAVELDFVKSAAEVVPAGVSYSATYGAGAWIAFVAVSAALCAALWERLTLVWLIGAVMASATIPLLAAGQFDDAHAVASAVRWGYAIWGAALAALVCARAPLLKLVRGTSWLRDSDTLDDSAPLFRAMTLVVTGLPLFGLTLLAVGRVFAGAHPQAGSLFAQMGPTWSYPLPLLVFVGMLVAFALRERTAAYMLAGSGVLHVVVILLYTLSVKMAGRPFDTRFAVELLQWNAIAAPAYALLWLSLRRWLEGEPEIAAQPGSFASRISALLALQLAFALALTAFLCTATATLMVGFPAVVEPALGMLGSWRSYTAWGLALLAAAWAMSGDVRRWGVHVGAGFAAALAALVAATVTRQTADGWLGLHVLTGGWLLVSAVTAIAACLSSRSLAEAAKQPVKGAAETGPDSGVGSVILAATVWSTAIVSVVVGIALVTSAVDVWTWWPGASVAAAAAISAVLALRPPREGYRYGSTALASLAAWLCYLRLTLRTNVPFDALEWPMIAALGCALGWLALEIRSQRKAAQGQPRKNRGAAVHHVVAVAATGLIALLVLPGTAICSLAPSVAASVDVSDPLGWTTLVMLGVLLVGMLWDRRARIAAPLAVLWGIVCFTMALDQHVDAPLLPALRDNPDLLAHFTWMAWGLALAAYSTLVARIWKRRERLVRLGTQLRIPDAAPRMEIAALWLPTAVVAMTALATLIELLVVLNYPEQDRWMRVAAAFAPALAAVACAWLSERGRESPMRLLSLLAATFSAVLLAWADMHPILENNVELLHWSVRLLVVLAGLALVYVLTARWLHKRGGGDWYAAVRQTAAACSAASLVVLGGVLLQELAFFRAEPHVLAVSEVATVALVLVALATALLLLALLPGIDPFSLSETARQAYVYGAQAVVALIFAHLYLSRPELFTGVIARYWPYIVMAIAFTGVALGELFHRLKIHVLAEPMTRTGALLPLLPALGIWVFAAEHTSRPLLLFIVGLLYALVSMLRRSTSSGLAAALAGNAALLVLMSEQGIDFKDNPQFWLIPPALSGLIAAQVNRRRLSEETLAAIRYGCMLVIYVSSTYEIFERDFQAGLWPPMLLTLLAVCGVLAGIALQIRAFLYLGTAFVLIAMITMVRHAAHAIDHTWPWWAFGVALGAGLLALYGLFEAKRREIAQLVERMRKWER